MFCKKCGTKLPDDSRFCYKCGTPIQTAEQKDSIGQAPYDPFDTPPTTNTNPAPQPQQQHQPQPQQQQAPAADEGLFGLLGFIFAFIFPLIGLIFSIIGMNKKKNNGLATAGLVVSIITILLVIIVIVIAVENTHTTYPYYYYI